MANPIETEKAHKNFSRNLKVYGSSILVFLAVSGLAWYAYGAGGKELVIQNQELIKRDGNGVDSKLQIKGMEDVDREELEKKIRQAQKSQNGNYALLAVQR